MLSNPIENVLGIERRKCILTFAICTDTDEYADVC